MYKKESKERKKEKKVNEDREWGKRGGEGEKRKMLFIRPPPFIVQDKS
jgi:hypothetical protein